MCHLDAIFFDVAFHRKTLLNVFKLNVENYSRQQDMATCRKNAVNQCVLNLNLVIGQ